METNFINIGLAFLEGFALILSPCILPIMPIVLSGSLEGGKKRPFGIIIGFIITFAVFTFFSREIILGLGIDANLIRNLSFALLLVFGFIMISDYLTELFSRMTQRLSNVAYTLDSTMSSTSTSSISTRQTPRSAVKKILHNPEGFISGLIFGGLIGLIWTPCAGPILAAVIVQAVLQKTTFYSFLSILFFGIGVAIPMLIIILFGREVMQKFKFLKTKTILIRKLLGLIIIGTVLFMIYGNSLVFSSFSFESQKSTRVSSITSDSSDSSTVPSSSKLSLTNGLRSPYMAPPISGIEAWINSKPLQLAQLKGKVVLIDFWAYSCINCIRTLPYLKDWYKKYQDKGLVIIGVHSPEFDFEKDLANVKKAVQDDDIRYPVALDNSFVTWQNYNNTYWPAHYLIDKNNNVVYQHFGEGDYDVTENNIRYLLGMDTKIAEAPANENFSMAQTPETYLGYERANQFHSPESVVKNKVGNYSYPNKIPDNAWALKGSWIITPQKIIATEADSAIKIHFYAGKVYAVLGNQGNKPIKVKILLNGELVLDENGKSVKDSKVVVTNHQLYSLIEFKRPSSGILELIASDPNLEVYTFTFGD